MGSNVLVERDIDSQSMQSALKSSISLILASVVYFVWRNSGVFPLKYRPLLFITTNQ